ncbi:MAG: metal ABC transporter substrate-binding protein [Gammaproteobacteria bacterium]|jgi:zinc transport system substrate-binding protein|nr:metal ABC transporter substrate-binding protein [Gammaproteobacteria bacterium]|tara:strand:+ start:5380 stop:6243 length:864 start_codon:yes stop_codon:yes gene_type:complete
MRNKTSSFFFIIATTVLASNLASAQVSIATTVRPLQLIAESIVGESGTVTSIVGRQDSPHQFVLTPSDRLAIASADLLIWIGPELEVYLADFLNDESRSGSIITVLENPALTIHKINDEIDAHFWLNSDNGIALAKEIKDRLIEIDQAQAAQYQSRFESFVAEIETTNRDLTERFSTSHNNYLVYHNAYQYFERQFGLQHSVALLADPETQPGIQHILRTRELVENSMPNCLLVEPESSMELATTLTDGMDIRTVSVDHLGYDVLPSDNPYRQLLLQVAESFESCIN